MHKRLFTALIILCVQTSFAETCPDVNQIKHPSFSNWKVYDSDNGTPLSPKRAAHFKDSATHFVLAEWAKNKNGGSIHCYYSDDNGSNLEAYLAKNNFIPENGKNFWYQVSGSMQCAAGAKECLFRSINLNQQQLAKK